MASPEPEMSRPDQSSVTTNEYANLVNVRKDELAPVVPITAAPSATEHGLTVPAREMSQLQTEAATLELKLRELALAAGLVVGEDGLPAGGAGGEWSRVDGSRADNYALMEGVELAHRLQETRLALLNHQRLMDGPNA